MRRFGRSILAFVLVLTALVMPGGAHAQDAESSCSTLSVDGTGVYGTITTIFPQQFTAGDHITITAGFPISGGGATPTTISFSFDSFTTQTAFPGTIEYTVPTTGLHTYSWGVNSANATWEVNCESEPPPTNTPVPPTNTPTNTATPTNTPTNTSTPTITPTSKPGCVPSRNQPNKCNPTSTPKPTNTPQPTKTPRR